MKRPRSASALAAGLLLALTPLSHALPWFGKKAPPLPTPTGMIASISGTVQYRAKGTASWVAAAINKTLEPGDEVRTGGDGTAIVSFSDGSKTQLTKNATFAIEGLEPRKIAVKIDVGLLEAWVKKVAKRRFYVRTPTAVASVRGTEFRVEVDPGGGVTWDLFGGGLEVANNFGQTVNVDAGQRVVVDVASNIQPPAPIPPSVQPTPEPAVPTPAAKEEGKAEGEGKGKGEGGGEKGEKGKEGKAKTQVLSSTGKIIITTADGKKIVVEPGKPVPPIPPGAKIEVQGGTAVIMVNGQAVTAGPGAALTISETGQVAAAPGSTPLTVTNPDGTTATVSSGETAPPPAATTTTTSEPPPPEPAPTETTTTTGEPPPPPPPNPTQETTTASGSTP